MSTTHISPPTEEEEIINQTARRLTPLHSALLTGGIDRPYAFGLAMALNAAGVDVEVIGGAEVDSPEMHETPGLRFLDLYGDPRETTSFASKTARILRFYARVLGYTAKARPRIFHLLWNNKLQWFDRTLLMLYYKAFGRKIVFTAHNVNAGQRDGNDSWLNRATLKAQYLLSDHIFVHTDKMKGELISEYRVPSGNVTVIPFGINNSVPDTDLTPAEAKRRLGIGAEERAILFFGAIRPYKGLEHLVAAFQQVARHNKNYRLIIAGESKKGSEQYWLDIKRAIEEDPTSGQVTQRIEFVPDSETELYFKAADVTVLPYTEVFQSGVLFLAYSFGLPVIASDVGSFRDDIIAAKTGYVARSCSPADLAEAIETYFASDLYRMLERQRQDIREYARSRNSWSEVADKTRRVYEQLMAR